MTFERWAAGLAPWYTPSLVDLWELSNLREREREKQAIVVVPNG